MFPCLILGDSIAVGTAMFAPKQCISYAQVGINSKDWNKKYLTKPLTAGIVVISLGTNDGNYIHTRDELEKMRKEVHSKKVYWILPSYNVDHSNHIIFAIAKEYGDVVIPVRHLSSDKIHPNANGYKEIVKSVDFN